MSTQANNKQTNATGHHLDAAVVVIVLPELLPGSRVAVARVAVDVAVARVAVAKVDGELFGAPPTFSIL